MNVCLISTSFSYIELYEYIEKQMHNKWHITKITISDKVAKINNTYHYHPLKNKKAIIQYFSQNVFDMVIYDAADKYFIVSNIIDVCKSKKILDICLMDRINHMPYQLPIYPTYLLTSNKLVVNQIGERSNVVLYDNFFVNYQKYHKDLIKKTPIHFEDPKILYINQNKKIFFGYFILKTFRNLIDKKYQIDIKLHYKDRFNKWQNLFENVHILKEETTDAVIPLLKNYDLVIGEDSELLFIANALGVPTIFIERTYEEKLKKFFEEHLYDKQPVPEHYEANTKISLLKAIHFVIKEYNQGGYYA